MKYPIATPLPFLIVSIGLTNAQSTSRNQTINWAPCSVQNGSTPIQCGTLTVPLDYSDPSSNRTIELSLTKVSALKEPRQGSILYNPGGPGISGLDEIRAMGETFSIVTGGYHDIVSFDPRGVGSTIMFECFDTPTERALAFGPFQGLANSSDTALGSLEASAVYIAETCYEKNREYGEMLGTAFVARDMLRIAEAIDDDGLLRYWGFSYGTVLGATFAAMFPDRVDRMVLDGVVNSHLWYRGNAAESVVQTDTVLTGFLEACIANPSQCLLAQDGISSQDLLEKVFQLLENVKYHPYLVNNDPVNGLIEYDTVKQPIFSALYRPVEWPSLAGVLHGIWTGNDTSIVENAQNASFLQGPVGTDSLLGIQCGDTTLPSQNFTALQPLIDATIATSRIAGDVIVALTPVTCAPWRFVAKEIYSGNFEAQTRTPILFVGGPFDPITPLVWALNMSAGFEGSVVLQHNGYGHTSQGQVSLCTARAQQAYFINGTLPAPGMVCQPDQALFANEDSVEVLEPLSNATIAKRAVEDEDDARLFAALKHLSRYSRVGRRV